MAADFRVSTPLQIQTALASAKPGDTLTMTNGVWTNANIVFQGYGTTTAPILLRAESYGGVILTGTSTLRISGKHLVVDGLLFKSGYSSSGDVVEFRGPLGESDSCRLTNSAIRDYNPPNDSTDYKWISLYGTHNRVDHCYVRGKKHSGTTLVVWLTNHPNYHQIDHNYFAYRPVLGYNGAETIRVGTSDWSMYDSFTTVENNLFEECNGEIETISNKSCENVYRFNTFVSCQGTLTLRHGNRCTVEGNFFFANHVPNSGGIRIIGEDHKVFNNYISGTDGTSLKAGLTLMNGVPNSPLNRYFQVKRAVVVHNTLVDNRTSINIGAGKDTELSLPPIDCTLANNVVSSTNGPLVTLTDLPINATWQGNVYYGSSVGMTIPTGNIVANPLLSVASDGIWRPASNSPLVKSSVGGYSFVVADMDGQNRMSPFEIGADEIAATPISRKPLKAGDVGPPIQLLPTSVQGELRPTFPPVSMRLESNYPNPFNPSTRITFNVPESGRTVLRVFNQVGEEIAVLYNGYAEPHHNYTTVFDASKQATGVYYARLEYGQQQSARKMLYVK